MILNLTAEDKMSYVLTKNGYYQDANYGTPIKVMEDFNHLLGFIIEDEKPNIVQLEFCEPFIVGSEKTPSPCGWGSSLSLMD